MLKSAGRMISNLTKQGKFLQVRIRTNKRAHLHPPSPHPTSPKPEVKIKDESGF
jgi:hypothetical protein